MNLVKQDKGITLVALIVTVVVMVIIAGVSINIGTESLDATRLKGFYTQLEVVQKRVDDIASTNEAYLDSSGNTVYLKEQGVAYEGLSSTQQDVLKGILESEGASLELTASNFRYFTSNQLKSILDLSEIEYNVFIDFDNRVIIAEEGVTVNDITYHILKNNIYFPDENTDKNVGTIESLSYVAIKYGDSYKITVIPSNAVGDLNVEGTLKYKKTTTKYWETSTNLEMIVNELTDYNIIYEDVNNNSISKTISINLNENGELTVIEIEITE